MSVKVLFWYEQNTRGLNYACMDGYITYFGAEPVVIDCLGDFKGIPGIYPIVYHSLQEALVGLTDHEWVFMHEGGSAVLDEFAHPMEPVVYATGSNLTGFGCSPVDLAVKGSLVRLRKVEVVNDHQVIPLMLYDRMLCQRGRRA